MSYPKVTLESREGKIHSTPSSLSISGARCMALQKRNKQRGNGRCGRCSERPVWEPDISAIKAAIVVRILTFGKEPFDANFWAAKLQSAWTLRLKLLKLEETNAFRVIHGEGDGIPGLIIDYTIKTG